MAEFMFAGAGIFVVGFILGCIFMVLVAAGRRSDDG